MSQREGEAPERVEGARRHLTDFDPIRMQALALLAETGSPTTAARTLGLPQSTVSTWAKQEGVAETLDALRAAIRTQSAHKYAAVASLSLDALLDRIVHGEYVREDGRTIRVPMKAKDLTMAASIATDKHALLTGMLSSEQKVDRALRELADKLVQAAGGASTPPASPDSPPGASPMPELG